MCGSLNRLLGFLKSNAFLVGLIGVILLAWAAPRVGELVLKLQGKTVAVVAIFLTYGLTTPLRQLAGGLARWRCHLVIQLFSFVVTPGLVYMTSGWMDEGALLYGVYLIAAVPTTISSCVVMATAAGGNGSCALANAIGGNVLGVFLSPLILAFLVGHGGDAGALPIGPTIAKLGYLVLAPLAGGMIVARLAPPIIRTVKP